MVCATSCPLETIPGEVVVSEVKAVTDARDSSQPNKGAKPNRAVYLSKDLYTFDCFARGESAMNLGHQSLLCLLPVLGPKIGGRDISHPDSPPPIQPANHSDLLCAQRTVPIEKNLNGPFIGSDFALTHLSLHFHTKSIQGAQSPVKVSMKTSLSVF